VDDSQTTASIITGAGLTSTELFNLTEKLADWSHQFFVRGITFSRCAAERRRTDPSAEFNDDIDHYLWKQRDRYMDAAEELHDIFGELQRTGDPAGWGRVLAVSLTTAGT
jgi:hypothetical protein